MLLDNDAKIIFDLIIGDASSHVFDSYHVGIDYWCRLFSGGCDAMNGSLFNFDGTFYLGERSQHGDGICYDEFSGREDRVSVIYSSDPNKTIRWKDYFGEDRTEVKLTLDEWKYISDTLHTLREL